MCHNIHVTFRCRSVIRISFEISTISLDVLNCKQMIKIDVGFILISIFREFFNFPARMKRSVFLYEDTDTQFCGFMELTFYKANENGYGRSEDIFIYRCAIATEKRRADGIPFPGVLHPGVGLSSTIYLLLENTSISAADLLLPSSIALSADALGSSSLHLQGSLGRKINIWYMFFE